MMTNANTSVTKKNSGTSTNVRIPASDVFSMSGSVDEHGRVIR